MSVAEIDWSELMEASLLALLESAEEGVLAFDRKERCRMIGRRAGELFGVDPGGHVGKMRDEVLRALSRSVSDPEAFLRVVGVQDFADPPKVLAEIEVLRPRRRRLVWTSFPMVKDAVVVGRLVLLRDVTRERSQERANAELSSRIEQITTDDVLTGLRNRRRFLEDLEREHGRSQRAWDSYAILRIDVDGMGEINDRFGQAHGDRTLRRAADCLNRCRRDYDVLARYENDEFAALLPGADPVAARTVASRFALAIDMQNFELMDAKVTVSVGGAVWDPRSKPTQAFAQVFERAGVALAKARAQGKGGIEVDGPASPGA
jgi:diguanylate cyclase (GGDEF)-like protein